MNVKDYIISISKERVAELPTMAYPAAITVVDSAAVAHSALRVLAKEKYIGFDTETRPAFRKGLKHKVALMQLSTDERCFLFRLNKIGICAELKAFLENTDITKIGLSIHDDFNVLRRSGDIEPKGFVDLQETVKRYGITDISLQKIYAILFGERSFPWLIVFPQCLHNYFQYRPVSYGNFLHLNFFILIKIKAQ